MADSANAPGGAELGSSYRILAAEEEDEGLGPLGGGDEDF